MSVLKLSESRISEDVFTAEANKEEEIDISNVLKFSVESLEETNPVYICFTKGSRSQNVAIPAGETRPYENAMGYKFAQKIYIHGGDNSAEVLVQRITAIE